MLQTLQHHTSFLVGFAIEQGCMIETFIERCVVGVEPIVVCKHPLYKLFGYHRRCLAIERRLASRVVISVARNSGSLAVHFLVGRLIATMIRQNGASMIDDADDRGENDCRTHCGCWCAFGIAVEGDRD